MYNKYLDENRNAFSELYRAVESDEKRTEVKETAEVAGSDKKKPSISLQRLLNVVDIDKVGLLPIVLLLLLLIDVDDDEKLIIIALAVIFGI